MSAAPRLLTVRSAVAPLQAEPRAAAEQVSQLLSGHSITVLEEREDWVRAHGRDEYAGWVHRGYLDTHPLGGDAPRQISLGCVARVRSSGRRLALPLGAWVAADATVESGAAVPTSELPHLFPPEPRAVVRTALRHFEGTRYEWGGVTPWGADCSGFVQTVFALHGVQLPRDAWQQAQTGSAVGAAVHELAAADLLFFSEREDGRVTHVGMAVGDGRMVHLALGRGGYAVERLERGTDDYVDALLGRFRFARRVGFSRRSG